MAYQPKPAIIDTAANLVRPHPDAGEKVSPQPILYREGHIVVHADLCGAQWGFVVTVPCGATLGSYRLKTSARKAARVINAALTHPAADTLVGLFGSEEQARAVYDAVKPLIMRA